MNPGDQHFRHEHKYMCDINDIMVLKHRISSVLKPDEHCGPDGSYLIRSIYFDDHLDSCVRDNEDGVSYREKWRIRTYDTDRSGIFLECKSKIADMTHKSSCRIDQTEFETIMKSQLIGHTDRELLNRFITLIQYRLMKPKIIVEYRRFPFICDMGNVRVTLDCDISSSTEFDRFFEPGIHKRPVLETGKHLLEVKFDEFLPDHVYHTIQMRNMQRISFSKYYLCRKFSPIC